MVNTELYPDTDFKKFLRRHSPREYKEPKKHVQSLNEFLEKAKASSEYMKEFIQNGVMNSEERKFHSQCIRTPLAKTKILFERKAMPSLVSKMFWLDNMFAIRPLAYLSQAQEFARAVSSSLKPHTPANYVELLDTSSHASVSLVFINSPATNFKTTWYKTLAVGVGPGKDFTEKGCLYPLSWY